MFLALLFDYCNLFEVYVTHTTGSNYFTWCSCILFSWIFKMIFSLSLAWHEFLWFLPIFGTNSGCKVRSFYTDKTMQSVEDTCFWKIVHANVVEMSRVPIIGWSLLPSFKTPFLEEVSFLYRFGSSNNVHIFSYLKWLCDIRKENVYKEIWPDDTLAVMSILLCPPCQLFISRQWFVQLLAWQ